MKAVGYIRVSTPQQAKEGESLDTQRGAIKRFVQSKEGWELVGTYADEGISGTKSRDQRPALRELYEDAKKKKFEYVVIHRLSRFGRNARDLLNNVQALTENGVQLVSIKDAIDYSTPSGKFMLTMLSAVAELEREIIEEQMKENKLARWKGGRTIVGSLPFGYKWNKEEKKIEVIPKEAELYNRIVTMYLDEGKSFSDIEEQLKGEGAKCGKKPWSSATISYALKNPIYYGHYVVNQTKYEGKRRTKEKKPASEHVNLKIEHPIISKTRWDQIQEKTAFNKSKGKHITISEDYFLRDALVCGECGGAVKPRHGSKRKDESRPRYYSCFWRGTSERELEGKGRKRCTLPYLNAEEIEEHVWYYLITYLTLQKLRKMEGGETPYHELFDLKKYENRIKSLSDQTNELEKEVKNKERVKDNLYTLLEKPGDHTNEFLEKLQKADQQLLTLKSKIDDCKQGVDNLREAKNNDKMYKEFLTNNKGLLKRLMDDLNRLPPRDKKQLVDSMLREKIRVWVSGAGGGRWEAGGPKFSFNKAILQRFMDEGKIIHLDQNAPHDPTGYEF